MGDERGELWDAEVQTRDPADVAAHAEKSLRSEWARAWELPVRFHRDRFEAAGFGPDEVPPLDEIPRFDKTMIRADEAANPPFGTHRVIGLEDAVRVGSSTGTTGTPTIILYGPNDFEVAGAVGVRNMWRHGVRAQHQVAGDVWFVLHAQQFVLHDATIPARNANTGARVGQ